MDTAIAESIGRKIAALTGARVRRGLGSEVWIDHHCLFHSDAHRSASYELQSGVYHCRTGCGGSRSIPLSEVAQKLGLDYTRLPGYTPPKPRTFTYRWPDGSASHQKHRQGDGKDKKIWQTGPRGEASLPKPRALVYPHRVDPGAIVLVVEGENKVEAVLAVDDSFQDHPIRAVTCGSAQDNASNARALAVALDTFAPYRVIVWPDNDKPGLESARQLVQELNAQGINPLLYRPSRDTPERWDVVDYLRQSGSLRAFVADLMVDKQTAQADTIAARLLVTADQQVIFPNTRRLARLDRSDVMAAAWRELTGATPDPKSVRALQVSLAQKAFTDPSRVAFRRTSTESCLWWRPAVQGSCFQVSANGIQLSSDPPGIFLALPGEELWAPAEVSLSGAPHAFDELCEWFGLSDTERAMTEGWMVAAMLGVQTPLLLVKGPAGTGKSTFARIITSVIEPIVPHLHISGRGNTSDERELVRTLQQSPALLLDNLSSVSGDMEDLLSQLVTGLTRSIRTLYEDSVQMLRMYRAMVVTSISWDPYKGDLSDRIVVVEPRLQRGAWKSERGMTQVARELVPRLRGHVLGRCVTYYRGIPSLNGTNPWRIGDLGYVFTTLGYDAADLARQEREQKAHVISLDDPILNAICDFWEAEDAVMVSWTSIELVDKLRRLGHDFTSIKLGRYLAEKRPIFLDRGLDIRPGRDHRSRFWEFRSTDAPADPVQEELLT